MVVFQDNGCQCLGEWSPSYIFPGHPPMPEGGHCLTDTNIQDIQYKYNKNGILQRQIYRYKYTNTKSVDTHCMKEEAFWVVGKGKKEDLIGGIYKRPTCLLSMRRRYLEDIGLPSLNEE